METEQITLGELIDILEPIAKKQDYIVKKYGSEADVCFDFASLYPVGFSSWRGAYQELAITFDGQEYNSKGIMTISKFLEALKECDGKTFIGWKGGDFTMDRHNRLWVANRGTVGSTGVSGIINNEYSIILTTATFEY